MSISDNSNVKLIGSKHHQKYYEIVNILCTDKMILLYESFSRDCIKKNNASISKLVNTEFDELYRIIISNRFEEILANKHSQDTIMDIVYEFNFLIHPYIDEFYLFCSTNINKKDIDDNIINFIDKYEIYKELVPLIYRLVNDYYLSFIKYQIKSIDEIF